MQSKRQLAWFSKVDHRQRQSAAIARTRVADQNTRGEKLLLFLPCIRQRLLPKRNLFAGPYAGEFGWELMQWQGFVRARRAPYEQVHVLTYPRRELFYEGLPITYPHNG